jgi:NADH:ubiquinone oxidoreductase subunit 6 (subunit J)
MIILSILAPVQTTMVDSNKEYTNVIYCLLDLIGEINAHNYGSVLYSYFAIQVLIIGMILLVVILGVFKLTSSVNKKTKTQSAFKQLIIKLANS